jgi:CubicO group peptidase (beta-lactamase class C family)
MDETDDMPAPRYRQVSGQKQPDKKFMSYLKSFTMLYLILTMLPFTPAIATGNGELAEQLDSIFEDFNNPDSPGISVAVIKDGQLLFSKGYGSAQLEYKIPVTTQTTFHVASVSKQFTAMSIMLLEADGKLSLDDEVQKHLAWVPRFEHPVTVRQLVNHTSGIRDQWELLYMAGWRMDDVVTMDDIRTMMKRQTELNFIPQSDILYSNMAYTLMADIVAEVSGKSFPDFTRERIFEPLGMTHTHFHIDHEKIHPDRSYSYSYDVDGELKKSVLSFANVGATSLFSTPEDLVLWLDNFRTHKLGSDQVIGNMLEVPKLSNGEPANLSGAGYAGGLMLGEYRGLQTIGHGGADAGFRASVQWFPQYNTAVAVTTNLASGDPTGHLHKAVDVVLKEHFPEPPPTTDPVEEFVEVDKAILERYAGMFQVEGAGVVSFIVDEDKLKAEISGMSVYTLKPLSETRFLLAELQAQLSFETNKEGRYDNVKVIMGPREMPGTRLAPITLTPETILTYTGTYYSPELRTQWDLVGSEGSLQIQHLRHGTINLLADPSAKVGQEPVEFIGDQWFVSKVVFEVNESGAVKGFRVTGGRVKNLWFQKL